MSSSIDLDQYEPLQVRSGIRYRNAELTVRAASDGGKQYDNWKARQNWFTNWFHDTIYAEWLPMAMSSGQIRLPFARVTDYGRVSWVPRSWAWVDPLKESNANKANLMMRVTSLSDIASAQGDEIEDVFDRLAKEKAMAETAGIDMTEIFGPFKQAQQASAAPSRANGQPNGHKLSGYEFQH